MRGSLLIIDRREEAAENARKCTLNGRSGRLCREDESVKMRRSYRYNIVGSREAIESLLREMTAQYAISEVINPSPNQVLFTVHNVDSATLSTIALEAYRKYALADLTYEEAGE